MRVVVDSSKETPNFTSDTHTAGTVQKGVECTKATIEPSAAISVYLNSYYCRQV